MPFSEVLEASMTEDRSHSALRAEGDKEQLQQPDAAMTTRCGSGTRLHYDSEL